MADALLASSSSWLNKTPGLNKFYSTKVFFNLKSIWISAAVMNIWLFSFICFTVWKIDLVTDLKLLLLNMWVKMKLRSHPPSFPLRVSAGNFVSYTRGPLHCPDMTAICCSDFPWPKEKWIVSSVFLLNSWHKAGIQRRTGKVTKQESSQLFYKSASDCYLIQSLWRGCLINYAYAIYKYVGVCVCMYICEYVYIFVLFSSPHLVDWRSSCIHKGFGLHEGCGMVTIRNSLGLIFRAGFARLIPFSGSLVTTCFGC